MQTAKPSKEVKRMRKPRTISFAAKKRREFAKETKEISFLGMTIVVKRG